MGGRHEENPNTNKHIRHPYPYSQHTFAIRQPTIPRVLFLWSLSHVLLPRPPLLPPYPSIAPSPQIQMLSSENKLLYMKIDRLDELAPQVIS